MCEILQQTYTKEFLHFQLACMLSISPSSSVMLSRQTAALSMLAGELELNAICQCSRISASIRVGSFWWVLLKEAGVVS